MKPRNFFDTSDVKFLKSRCRGSGAARRTMCESWFNSKPAAQADRRSADLFERRRASTFPRALTRNVASNNGNSAAPFPLLFEAR